MYFDTPFIHSAVLTQPIPERMLAINQPQLTRTNGCKKKVVLIFNSFERRIKTANKKINKPRKIWRGIKTGSTSIGK